MDSHRTRRSAIAAAIAVALLALGATPAQALHLDYIIDLGIEHNDNITLSPDNPISQDITRAGFGFALSENSATLQASVTGRVDGRSYSDDAYADALEGVLSARLNWILLPQRLSFTVEDNLGLQSINTLAPDTPSNRQQTNVFTLGPTLFFDFSSTTRGEAELRWSDSDAEETEEFNSQRLGLALRAVRDLDAVSSLALNLQGLQVDYDADLIARDYDRVDAFARYSRTLARFDLGLDAGYSRLSYDDDGPDRSSPLLRAELGWGVNERNRFELSVTHQFSDAAIDAAVGPDAGGRVPGAEPIGNMVVNASAFRQRRIALDYSHTGSRATLTVSPYLSRIDYIDADDFDQDNSGVNAALVWRLNQDLSMDVLATQQTIDYRNSTRKDDTVRFGAGLRRQLGRHWSARVEWSSYRRDSTVAEVDADQRTVFVGLTYTR